MADTEIVVGVSARAWADRLHRFCEDHGGARVRARVIDERGTLAQQAQVVVVDDTASYLTGRLVDRLHARGTAVVVVVDAAQAAEVAEWVGRLGVDAIVPDDEPPDRLVATVASVAAPSAPTPSPDPGPIGERGRLVAVAGVSGGVGATEVSVALAHAATGSAVLVDLDLSSPSIAQRLRLPLHPNLRSAVDAHRSGAGLDGHLHDAGAVSVLAGPAGSGEWSGLDAGDVVALLEDLAIGRTVVVNLPAGPPRPHPHGAVTVADVARPALRAADVAVAVTLPSPIGVSRVAEWLAAAEGLTDRLHLAVNRTPPSVFRRQEARLELERAFELPVWFLPDDATVDRAGWAGEVVRRGAFRRATRRLAEVVAA